MTIRQAYYKNATGSPDVIKIDGLYELSYLKVRVLECLYHEEHIFNFLLLACAKCVGIQRPTERALNKLFREHILFDPENDILCQNYEDCNQSLLLRVREYVLTDNFIRAMQLYLVYLCNREN